MTAVSSNAPSFVLDPSWRSFSGLHGGWMASRLLEAASRLTDDPPRSLHAEFPAPAPEGNADIETELIRQGRSATFVTAGLRSDGRVVARASVVFGPARPGPTIAAPPPGVEPPQNLDELVVPAALVPFTQHFEYRPSQRPFAMDGGPAELMGWVRFRDGRAIDERAATVIADAIPPALYRGLSLPVPIPTAQLSLQFCCPGAAEGWALVRIVTRSAGEGWCVDDSDVWTQEGRHVASARQTRLVLGGES